MSPLPQPIPAQVSSVASAASDLSAEKSAAERKEEEDSITDEIAELRTPDVAKRASDWVSYFIQFSIATFRNGTPFVIHLVIWRKLPFKIPDCKSILLSSTYLVL